MSRKRKYSFLSHSGFVLAIISILCFDSCNIFRHELYTKGGREEMFHNAIIDFIHTEHRLLQESSAFHVFSNPDDSCEVFVFGENYNKVNLIAEIKDNKNIIVETAESGATSVIDTIIGKVVMTISDSDSKNKPSVWFDENAVDISYRSFPDGVFEYGDKLFFWFNDSTGPKRHEIIETVYRHNFVDTLVFLNWPYAIDDSRVGIKYVFHHPDLRVYKKRKSK